jgi:hypothetical protein
MSPIPEAAKKAAHGELAMVCRLCGRLAWWHLQSRGTRGDDGHAYNGPRRGGAPRKTRRRG